MRRIWQQQKSELKLPDHENQNEVNIMRKILLILIISLFASLSLAQDDIEPELAEQIEGLEVSTEGLRGLEASQDVDLAFPSREDVGVYLAESFAEYYTPEIVAQEMAFYSAFGFIPADYDLVAGLTELYSGQVAGYYDTEDQSMNVINSGGDTPDESLPLLDQIIYVHEYTHALQDQYFDIDSFIGDSEGDASLAKLSLIEGDATTVMSLYVAAVAEENPLGTLLQLGAGIAQLGNISLPEGTPRIIGEELNFPYLQGQSFVVALIEEGGWELVNAAYTDNPPLSSEQILHPDAYLAGDEPYEMTLDIELEGWEIAKQGVFGEFYLREWLRQYDLTASQINTAATGWGGDSYIVFISDEGAAFFLQLAFDTEGDHAEFINTIELFAGGEAGGLGSNQRCWQAETSFICMRHFIDAVQIISAPTEDVILALLGG
jgi:hypothetical protein